jgi:aryl carrier-like protein
VGRYLSDGNLEFLGRNDFQVKVRGFRIELGEIESRLMSHGGVREAVVLAREDEAGDKRLVAYYTQAEGTGEGASTEELRRYLSSRLPEHMVPAAYVVLEALPLTANGKLDRRALPAPDSGAYGRGEYEAPESGAERVLAEIWSEVLGVQAVGRHDNFFELGGHSLLAIRVLERMRRAGLQADVRALFDKPVLSQLAAAVEVNGVVAPPIRRVERDGLLLPSFGQQRLWFLSQWEEASEAYHIPFGLRLRGGLNEEALVGSMNDLMRRLSAIVV